MKQCVKTITAVISNAIICLYRLLPCSVLLIIVHYFNCEIELFVTNCDDPKDLPLRYPLDLHCLAKNVILIQNSKILTFLLYFFLENTILTASKF